MTSKKITFSAIIAAFSLILLYVAFIIPTGKIGLFILASILLSSVVIECGALSAFLCYIVVSLLSFFLIPDKSFVLPFVFFFGYYPILKAYLEKKKKNVIGEYAVKLVCGNLAFLILYFTLKTLFTLSLGTIFFVLLWIGANILFLIYDIIFSMIIQFYYEKIHQKLHF